MTEDNSLKSKDISSTEGEVSISSSPSTHKVTKAGANLTEAIAKGEEIYKSIKDENEKAQKILEQNQELAARKLVGGGTDAGTKPEEKKEETPLEYAKRVERGEI